jgi:hypothetical protein
MVGLGFQPDLVLVRSNGADPVILRTSTVTSDASKVLSEVTALQPDLVQSLDGDGFTVGTDARVNGAGVTFYWTAMKAGSDLTVESYVGNGADNRRLAGWLPRWDLPLPTETRTSACLAGARPRSLFSAVITRSKPGPTAGWAPARR